MKSYTKFVMLLLFVSEFLAKNYSGVKLTPPPPSAKVRFFSASFPQSNFRI